MYHHHHDRDRQTYLCSPVQIIREAAPWVLHTGVVTLDSSGQGSMFRKRRWAWSPNWHRTCTRRGWMSWAAVPAGEETPGRHSHGAYNHAWWRRPRPSNLVSKAGLPEPVGAGVFCLEPEPKFSPGSGSGSGSSSYSYSTSLQYLKYFVFMGPKYDY